MRLEHLHKLALYATVGLALLALGTTAKVPLLPLDAVLVGLSALLRPGPRSRVLHWLGSLVSIALMSVVVVRAFEGAAVLQPALRFLLMLLLVKLFLRHRVRDDLQILALSFLAVTVSAVLAPGVLFGLVALVYAGTLAAALATAQLLRQHELAAARVGTTSTSLGHAPRLGSRDLGLFASTATLFVISATLLFFTLPRFDIGLGRAATKPVGLATGFAPSIDLAQHGRLQLDATEVLRARGPRLAGTAYWRGMGFDAFDGKRWHVSWPLQESTRVQAGGAIDLGGAQATTSRYLVELAPTGTPILFTLWPSSALQLLEQPADVAMMQALDHTVRLAESPTTTIRYQLEVAPGLPSDPAELPVVGYSVDLAQASFLRLGGRPQELAISRVSKDVVTLGRSLRRPNDDVMETTRRVFRYVREQHDYTLDIPPHRGAPLDGFLFDSRRGHCELFSTALTVLLRAAGIPARNVNGFVGGDYDPLRQTYVVRRLHAHSWTEAWIPRLGWVLLDPTPGSAALEQAEEALQQERGLSQTLREGWSTWVVRYDPGRQAELFGGDELRSASSGRWARLLDALWSRGLAWLALIVQIVALRIAFRRNRRPLLVLALGLGMLALTAYLGWGGSPPWPVVLSAVLAPLYLAWRWAWASAEGEGTRRAAHPLAKLYERFLARLAKHRELAPLASLPPAALARELSARALDEHAAFVRDYAHARFAPGAFDAPTQAALLARLRRLRWS